MNISMRDVVLVWGGGADKPLSLDRTVCDTCQSCALTVPLMLCLEEYTNVTHNDGTVIFNTFCFAPATVLLFVFILLENYCLLFVSEICCTAALLFGKVKSGNWKIPWVC